MRFAWFALGFLACETKNPPPPPAPPRAIDAAAATSATPAAPLSIARPSAVPPSPPADAGPSSCKLAAGPTDLHVRGSVVVLPDGRVIGNVEGKPAAPHEGTSYRWPPCAVTAKHAFCTNPSGELTRSTHAGVSPKVVARAARRTRTAAVDVGAHTIVAWLEVHPTSEGEQLQAFGSVDDSPAVRLSEDGAGATAIQLAAFADHATLVYLDARSAMMPVHARTLTVEGGKLVPTKDVVLHVAGPPERGVDFVVASAKGKSPVVLVPMPKDTADFGVAALPLADPPAEAAPAWSMYPNGLDPAPIAATRDGAAAYVARIRPEGRAADSARVLELGKLDDAGAFTSLGTIAPGKAVQDVSVAAAPDGSLWIAYGDATSSWLERRVCP